MSEAQEQYQAGLDLKAKGQTDAALTAFRRAAIADPSFFDAQYEIGVICRDKGRRDPKFKRPAFDAFRAAARINLDHEKAHDAYIVAGQESGKLEDLLFEYGELIKANPQNENLKRCYKNLTALIIAMVPKQGGDQPATKGSAAMKKFIYVVASNLVFSGIFSIVAPFFAAKAGYMNEELTGGVPLGVAFLVGGMILFAIGRRQR